MLDWFSHLTASDIIAIVIALGFSIAIVIRAIKKGH